jgi:hypothetical protein
VSDSISVSGLDELAAQLGIAVERLTAAASAATYAQGVAIIELIRRKTWIPIHTGRLAMSAYVTLPEKEGNALSVEVGYGAPYAGSRHEMGTHQTKWLEKSLGISARAMQIRIYESLVAALKGGFTAAQMQAQLSLPTGPYDPGAQPEINDYQRKYGWSKEQRAVIRQWQKAGLRIVKRWTNKHRKPKRRIGRQESKRLKLMVRRITSRNWRLFGSPGRKRR